MGKDLETERQIALPSDFVRLAIALLGRACLAISC